MKSHHEPFNIYKAADDYNRYQEKIDEKFRAIKLM